jgi:hypothetical protein
MLLMTVRLCMRVPVRRGCCEPRVWSRLEHVTRNSSQLVAMRRQMRVSKTLCLCRMGQDIRWSLLLGKCVRRVRVQLIYEWRVAATAEASR